MPLKLETAWYNKPAQGNVNFNSKDLNNAVLNAATLKGTFLASGTVTLPAFTAGDDITLAAGKTLKITGATSGVVTVKVAAAAGTWTMTLPTAVGTAGYQLTDAAGDGVTSWTAAGSRREWKNILGPEFYLSPSYALGRILGMKVRPFVFKKGYGTGDYETVYQGPIADEAPWAMHFPGEDGVGGILNSISTFGHTALSIQELHRRLELLERQYALPVP